MYSKTKLHNGLMADCAVCTPDRKKKRRDRDDRPKRERATNIEGYLKRQMAEEIGEDELSKDFRFQLMQKYGTIAPRIDRRVTRPSWMEESRWKTLKQEFHNLTKGLVPSQQFSPKPTNRSASTSNSLRNPLQSQRLLPQHRTARPWSEIHHKKYNGPKPKPSTSVPPLTPRQL